MTDDEWGTPFNGSAAESARTQKGRFQHRPSVPRIVVRAKEPELEKDAKGPEQNTNVVGFDLLGHNGPAPELTVLPIASTETTTSVMTAEDHISRAKNHIGTGETSRNISFRAAADDIALACDKGAKQREIAKGVGKSVAWVNRLLKWREGGYVGAPFADKIVQGVNKEPAGPEPPSIELASPAVLGEINAIALGHQEAVNAEAATAPATTTSAALPPVDYHLPAELNRQDPERAFRRLPPVHEQGDQASRSAEEQPARSPLLVASPRPHRTIGIDDFVRCPSKCSGRWP